MLMEGLGFLLLVALLIVGSVVVTGLMVWLASRHTNANAARWHQRCRTCYAQLAILEAELEARPVCAAYAPVLGGEITFEETDGVTARLN